MTINFAPLVNPLAVVSIALVYLALTLGFYLRFRHLLARRQWWLLVSCKLVAVALVLSAVFNPYFVEREPDPSTFQVLYLIDATGSMETRDADGQRRLDLVKEQLLAGSPLYERLQSRYRNNAWYLFSGDQLRRFEGETSFDVLPGETDIDTVLEKALASNNDRIRLGAVVLVSDGLDNQGRSLMEAAGAYKAAGIPIHTIGIGSSESQHDLSVEWLDLPAQPVKGKPMKLEAKVARNFSGEAQAQLEFFEGNRLIETRPIRFEADSRSQIVQLDHTSFTAGFKTAKLKLSTLPDEENVLNNVDYAGITVIEPDVFDVLYFSNVLDWEYKYLNLLAGQQENFHLDAVIQLGPTSWFVRGVAEAEDDLRGFPPADLLHEYDALIVNVHSLSILSEQDRETMINFLEFRGGGIIFTGVTDRLPEDILRMMPIRQLPEEVSATRERGQLMLRPSALMSAWNAAEAANLSVQLYVPDDMPYFRLAATDLKPGAVPVATLGEAEWIMVTAQRYGSGKVVLDNLGSTWKWVMQEEKGDTFHGRFWSKLITWASSSLQERMTVKPSGAKLRLGADQEITLDLLDQRYRPDNAARIEASYFAPDGTEETVSFLQDPRIDGRYVARFIPRQQGEYRWVIQTELHDGEVLEQRTDYVVVEAGSEYEPAPLAEEKLRSLARVTQGQYWHHRDLNTIDELPITQEIRYLEERHYWLNSWVFLLAVLLAVMPDWILRRRVGLR